jgi:RluA family pseudouridine synthase
MKLLVPTSQKLVPFLQYALPDAVSGKMVRRLLEANLCRVNGKVERFGSAQLTRGDIVEVSPAWKSLASPALLPKFKTLYENPDLILVDKPAQWVCSEENCRRTFGPHLKLVHRLDKDTTGVLALAKTPKALAELIDLFAKREVEKDYLAIVDGVPSVEEGVRESYLAKKRVFDGQTIWGSSQKGLHAITRWKKLSSGKAGSLLLAQPYTGRTHQIRVHLAEMGHPILVDRQYASQFRSALFAARPLLHAFRLNLGNGVQAVSLLPLDMWNGISSLRMEVRHLRQFFGSKPHEDRRDDCNDDEDAKEIEQSAHFSYEPC